MRKDRLKKLADFLDKLPTEKWDFSTIATGNTTCPSAACAIGWLPTIFPKSNIKLCRDESRSYWNLDVFYKGRLNFAAATMFFDIPLTIALSLFDPEHYSTGDSTTSEMVSKKIRHYIKTGECIDA